MFRLEDSALVVARWPVTVTVGRSGLAPVVMLGALFAMVAARAGLPVGTAAVIGGIGGTVSLLVHELGHVRAARALTGVRAAAVSLVWLGAATRFEGAYASGREQSRVALGGPQASLALAASLGCFCYLPLPFPVKELVIALALFNVAVAALNLVPAHPLDGHKLVVGMLWSVTGSEATSRRIVRCVGLGFLALELPGIVFLLATRPDLGLIVATLALVGFAQRQFARHHRNQVEGRTKG